MKSALKAQMSSLLSTTSVLSSLWVSLPGSPILSLLFLVSKGHEDAN